LTGVSTGRDIPLIGTFRRNLRQLLHADSDAQSELNSSVALELPRTADDFPRKMAQNAALESAVAKSGSIALSILLHWLMYAGIVVSIPSYN
jgi:hypothetical protein